MAACTKHPGSHLIGSPNCQFYARQETAPILQVTRFIQINGLTYKTYTDLTGAVHHDRVRF